MSCAAGYVEDDEMLKACAPYHAQYVEQKRDLWKSLALLLKEQATHLGTDLVPCAEIGCGLGGLTDALRQQIGHTTGYDINPHIVEAGRKLFPKTVLLNRRFGEDGFRFGLVASVDTFEHMAEPFKVLKRVVESLLPGGLFYLFVPRVDEQHWTHLATESVEDQMIFSTASPFHDMDVHVTHFSTPGLAAFGERAGLQVVQDFATQMWPMNGILYRKP